MFRRLRRSTLFPYTTLFRSRQTRGENEGLEVFAPCDRVGEDHQEPRVAFHRTADVADQNDRSPLHTRLASEQRRQRSEEHTSELQSHSDLVCRLLLEKKNTR